MSVDVDLDGEDGDVSAGLTALVVAVVEILIEALEAEAVRRMESGDLSDDEVERLGGQLLAIEEEIEELKRTAGVVEATADLRDQLDGVVHEALVEVDDARSGSGPGPGPGPGVGTGTGVDAGSGAGSGSPSPTAVDDADGDAGGEP